MYRMSHERTFPKFDELMWPIILTLRDLGGSAANDELYDVLLERLQLPEEMVERPHKEGSNETRLRYRHNWAKSYLKKTGYLDNSERGVWSLTALGRDAKSINTATIKRLVRNSIPSARKQDEDDGEEQTASWSEQLLVVLQSISPDAFERLCKLILRESGFTKVEVTGKSGDGGIDGQGVLRINLISFRVVFQAKRYKGSVGSETVRLLQAATQGRADKGLVITTGRFTADARKEATRDGAPAIDLIDGDDLCELLKELRIGVKVTMVPEIEIDETVFRSI